MYQTKSETMFPDYNTLTRKYIEKLVLSLINGRLQIKLN